MKRNKQNARMNDLVNDVVCIFQKNIDDEESEEFANLENLHIVLGKVLEFFSLKTRMDTDFTDDLKFIIGDYFESFLKDSKNTQLSLKI